MLAGNYVLYIVPVVVVVVVLSGILGMRRKSGSRSKLLNNFREAVFPNESDLSWYIAHDIMGKAGFPDCVVYIVDQQDQVCRQIAAYGPKNPEKMSILNPINIPFGRGIVGHVAVSGKMEKIDDTTSDKRYVPDDDVRYSELTVPVVIDGVVTMVIDSEHKNPAWFKDNDVKFVVTVAEISMAKLLGLKKNAG